jgi:hypothetical protein
VSEKRLGSHAEYGIFPVAILENDPYLAITGAEQRGGAGPDGPGLAA